MKRVLVSVLVHVHACTQAREEAAYQMYTHMSIPRVLATIPFLPSHPS